MTNTCKTCRHWTDVPGHRTLTDLMKAAGMRKCMAVPLYDEIANTKDLGRISSWDDEWAEYSELMAPKLKALKAVGSDREFLQADLITTPDFGCVLWTPLDHTE